MHCHTALISLIADLMVLEHSNVTQGANFPERALVEFEDLYDELGAHYAEIVYEELLYGFDPKANLPDGADELHTALKELAEFMINVHNGADKAWVGLPGWRARDRTLIMTAADEQEVPAGVELIIAIGKEAVNWAREVAEDAIREGDWDFDYGGDVGGEGGEEAAAAAGAAAALL